jgi:hypothetical protein
MMMIYFWFRRKKKVSKRALFKIIKIKLDDCFQKPLRVSGSLPPARIASAAGRRDRPFVAGIRVRRRRARLGSIV